MPGAAIYPWDICSAEFELFADGFHRSVGRRESRLYARVLLRKKDVPKRYPNVSSKELFRLLLVESRFRNAMFFMEVKPILQEADPTNYATRHGGFFERLTQQFIDHVLGAFLGSRILG